MSEVISIYSTFTQAKMLELELPPRELLQSRYFPTDDARDTFQGKEVVLDFDKGDLKAGVFVQKGYIDGNTTIYRANAVEAPRVGLSDSIDPTDQDRLMFESLMYEQGSDNPSRADAFNALKRIKVGRLARRIYRAIERTCVNVLINNSVEGTIQKSAADSDVVSLDIKYYDPDKGNLQRYVVEHAWGADDATPYRDVCKMVTELFEHGGKPEDLLIAPEAWMLLNADAEFQKQYTTYHTEGSTLFGREIEGARAVGTANFVGYMLNIIVYCGAYQTGDDDAPLDQYLPKDFVCVLAPNCGRTLCGGCTLIDPASLTSGDINGNSFRAMRGKVIGSEFADIGNQQLNVRVESRPLPSPERAWQWITCLAQNTNEIAGGRVGTAIDIRFESEVEGATLPNDLVQQKAGDHITVSDASATGETFDKWMISVAGADPVEWVKGDDGKYVVPTGPAVAIAIFE